MSFIDPENKQINCKIVYVGPVLAGKSTTLRSIPAALSGNKLMKKLSPSSSETLFFNFLPLSLGSIGGHKIRVHLYSIPSPILFEANQRLILKGIDGVIFVADSQLGRLEENITCLRELDELLHDQELFMEEVPLVFQYNKRDLNGKITPIDTLNKSLNPDGRPWFESVARKKQGVLEPLQALTKQVLQELRFD